MLYLIIWKVTFNKNMLGELKIQVIFKLKKIVILFKNIIKQVLKYLWKKT